MIKKFFLIITLIPLLTNAVLGNNPYRDSATEKLFQSLKKICYSDAFLFGVPNALTISYKGGPKHAYNNTSDCKDITGSHPGFIESDFEWYVDAKFKAWDIEAMKKAYQKGIVLGYCYHLRGPKSGEFYTFGKDGNKLADSTLVKDILANPHRQSNESLNWYLTRLDTLVIPVFKELGFPLIYRPFHEMTGNWFWWGTATCTPNEFIQLYRLTVEYIRKAGVKNILYAWSPDKSADMQFYPGDEYVDIIGYDGYDVGIADYHSIPFFVENVSKLAKIAKERNKVFAITEVGLYSLNKYPQYWTQHIFKPLHEKGLISQLAWIMTWYNADWNNDNKGISYIPYKGIEQKENGQQAIDDFRIFFNFPQSIFQTDSIPFYKSDDKIFIYPTQLKLSINETFSLIAGRACCWMNEKVKWKSKNATIASVDNTGMVTAHKKGITYIIATTKNGQNVQCKIEVK